MKSEKQSSPTINIRWLQPESVAANVGSAQPSGGAVAFGPGDTMGKRDSAVDEARQQLARVEDGSVRAKLYSLQSQVGDLPEVDCPLQHVFAPGAYARTIFIPANTVIVGKIHKHSHLNILSQGTASVLTESGGTERLQGPLTMVSPPGTKRAVFAHTDVVWTTIHLTDETDLGKIEDHVIAKTYEDYEQFRLDAESHKLEIAS